MTLYRDRMFWLDGWNSFHLDDFKILIWTKENRVFSAQVSPLAHVRGVTPSRAVTMRSALLMFLLVIGGSTLTACAGLQSREPLQVAVADIETLPGEGLEWRMTVKLRVQNPNDTPVEYDGVYLKMVVQDQTFATGVSDERGSIPRFGETVISVPMTVPILNAALNTLRLLGNNGMDKINYRLDGKLDGPTFGSTPFHTEGEFALPAAPAPGTSS